MSVDIFIGADGGGTKTKVQVEDIEGNILGHALVGPGNIRTDVDLAYKSVMSGIEVALADTDYSLGDKDVKFHVGLGLAGFEVPEACDAFLAKDFPFETIELESDAIIACLGAHAGEDGAIVIVGTGVHGCEVFKNQLVHVGGWGFPHGDEGGGAWLGMEAVRIVLRSVDGRAYSTTLCEEILRVFDDNVSELITWATAAGPSDFATLAPLVIEQAEHGDPHAAMLLESAALEIDMVAQALEDAIDGNYLSLALFGGIAPHLKSRMNSDVKNRIVERQFDATRGAVFLARQKVLGDQWKEGLKL